MVQERLDPHKAASSVADGAFIYAHLRELLGVGSLGQPSRSRMLRPRKRPSRRRVAALDALDIDPPHATATGTAEDWRPTVWFNPWMYQTGEQIGRPAHEITPGDVPARARRP